MTALDVQRVRRRDPVPEKRVLHFIGPDGKTTTHSGSKHISSSVGEREALARGA
jgi:hypothetical protein